MALTSTKNKSDDLRLIEEVGKEKFFKKDLKTFWSSLFKPELYIELDDKDSGIFGTLMLLQTATETVKQVGLRCTSLLVSYNSSLKELEETKAECSQLKDNIKSLMNTPCKKCSMLKSQLKDANKKAEEAQARMKSIARILALGEDKNSQSADKCGNTANLVTQMLLGTSESPKRKKRLLLNQAEVKANDVEILVPETVQHFSCNNRSPGLEVPETVNESPTTNASPLLTKTNEPTKNFETNANEKKTFSSSINIPPCGHIETRVPKKNLTANFDKSGKENKNSPPKKLVGFDLKIPWKEKGALEELDNSPQDYMRHDNSELERIWFNNDELHARPEAECESNNKEKFWKLKESRASIGKGTVQGGRKRLKQMTLSVGVKGKKKDVSQMEGFAGGNPKNIESSSQEEEMDIVLPSPRGKIKNLKKKKNKQDLGNVNLFAPLATSTQIQTCMQDNSVDRLPVKKKTSPNYKYKQETVRGKEERAKIEGRQCLDCEDYYRAAGLSAGELQNRLNACSRHRDKHPRAKSPLGFWDPVMPDTQECRERGLYTSVIHLKDSKKK